MRMRVTEALGAVVVLAVTISACAIAIVSLCGCSSVEQGSMWQESTEFSELETGQGRFSVHDTNLDYWYVVVDHSTGVQYLYRYKYGLTPLLDADGTPLLVAGAG